MGREKLPDDKRRERRVYYLTANERAVVDIFISEMRQCNGAEQEMRRHYAEADKLAPEANVSTST